MDEKVVVIGAGGGIGLRAALLASSFQGCLFNSK